MKEKLFKIVEIFGPTIQGEGYNIGELVSFVRFAGCDFNCKWCDTQYARDEKKFGKEWKEMNKQAIGDALGSLGCNSVVFSGGNPAIHELGELIIYLHSFNYFILVETQGSIFKDWFSEVDYLTLSPKPPSSGMKFNDDVFNRFINNPLITDREIKVVVGDEKDLEFLKMLCKSYPDEKFVVQTLNPAPGAPNSLHYLLKSYAKLIDTIKNDELLSQIKDLKVLPQLQVLLWGNMKGV